MPYRIILVCRDSNELRFWERLPAAWQGLQPLALLWYDVYSCLVLVQGVEDKLQYETIQH